MKYTTLTVPLIMLAIESDALQAGFSLERQYHPDVVNHVQKGFIGVLTQSGFTLDAGMSYREEKSYRYENVDYWGNDLFEIVSI